MNINHENVIADHVIVIRMNIVHVPSLRGQSSPPGTHIMYIILQRNDWKFATEDMDYVVVNPAGDIVFRNMTKSVVEALFMKLSKEATMTYKSETPIPVTYRVTANHVHPDYRFTKTKVKIGYSDYDKTYWASHPKLGCSKSFTTPENAIYSLFHDHACTGVTITKTED